MLAITRLSADCKSVGVSHRGFETRCAVHAVHRSGLSPAARRVFSRCFASKRPLLPTTQLSGSKTGTKDPIKTLGDLGITRNESKRWQKLAEVPKTVFEQHIHRVQAEAGIENHRVLRTP